VCACADESNRARGLPALELIEHATLTEDRLGIVVGIDILGKKEIDRVAADCRQDIAARRAQSTCGAGAAAAGQQDVVAPSGCERMNFVHKWPLSRGIEEEEIDARFKCPPNASAILVGIASQRQATCATASHGFDFRLRHGAASVYGALAGFARRIIGGYREST
jgi:hypothetical protein